MQMEFSIDSWSAWSSEIGGPSNWSGTETSIENSNQTFTPDISSIPAMKRRRMSFLSKMAISTALDCLNKALISDDVSNEPQLSPLCVFASQHGELERSMKILGSMVESQEISPTDFSLSVHNTSLGLFSILTKNSLAATSIAAGGDTFGYGLMEACLQLKSTPEKQVLYLYFDQPLPEVIREYDHSTHESICISLLLSSNQKASEQFSFSCKSSNVELSSQRETTNFGRQFLDSYLSTNQSICIGNGAKIWKWNRQC